MESVQPLADVNPKHNDHDRNADHAKNSEQDDLCNSFGFVGVLKWFVHVIGDYWKPYWLK